MCNIIFLSKLFVIGGDGGFLFVWVFIFQEMLYLRMVGFGDTSILDTCGGSGSSFLLVGD